MAMDQSNCLISCTYNRNYIIILVASVVMGLSVFIILQFISSYIKVSSIFLPITGMHGYIYWLFQ